MSVVKHYYLHADLDAFFASVEQLDNPEYLGKPVIVGGKPEDKRSVVSTASYEARVFGVHSAMPIAKAYQLCPQGIYVYGRMKRYSELSYQIMNIFRDFSPDVQQMSIDEAFIDLTGTENLFGPPKETAMKIKQRVKEETGLTVSIGLAPTKYLAKLASDMKKPDGFYCIEEGTEQEFMMNLPLKKVWGIGDKTYDALKTNGLRTTRDVYEKSLESLTFMFGQNTGNFLYYVVRGIDVVDFDRKAKTHSISNETTFPVDISDIYTVETSILELCHSVIFRLLKENGFSRTVMVKIRYEDFSTVSIQQTFSFSVLTLDSLYAAAKELFEKKYERGRGVRLIGIALENIESSERPFQQSLFDDGSEKKQKVEKAILTLEKKHPEIKIHKARMLESIKKGVKVLAAVFLLISVSPILQAQEISGYWKGDMEGAVNSTFGFGNPFGISAQPPVFKQEVDLSLLFHITPHFFFSLEFMDEFKHNTYTLGYDGDKYLKLFRFSNRGITFPSEYSSMAAGYGVSGGQNEAPGIMFNFTDYETNKWSGDFMLRYDMTETKTATFYGNNRVTDSNIKLDDYADCSMFVIPSEQINNIKNVYIQSEAGTYKDTNGILYERLSQSDYLVYSSQKLLVLSRYAVSLAPKNKVPYVLVSFINEEAISFVLNDTGNYSDSTSFAGKIQEYFNSSDQGQIELSEYSVLDIENLTRKIIGDNNTALILQSPDSFSPYLCANIYKAFENSDADFLVTDNYSGTQNAFYTVIKMPYSFDDSNYVMAANSKNNINDTLAPEYRYPFADRYPLLYLTNSKDAKERQSYPLVITARNYNPVKNFDIGKKVSAGTVQVYVNGILEPGAVYDDGTGYVSLPFQPNELDKIYITYSEESSDISNGAFVTAVGFIYNFIPELTLDLSFTGKYPYTAEKYKATPSNSYGTFSAFTTGLTYSNNELTAYDKIAAAIEDTNTTDIMMTGCDSVFINSSKAVTANYSFVENKHEKIDILWNFENEIESPDTRKIIASSYFTACDFSQYETINFDFAITQPVSLSFILESALEEKILEITLDEQLCSELANTNTTYHTLSVTISNNAVTIDGTKLNPSQYTITLNKGAVPQVQKTIIIPDKSSHEGHAYVSGVYYKNNTPSFAAKNIAGIKYQDKIWYAEAESTQGTSVQTDNGKNLSKYIDNSVKAGVTYSGIKLAADSNFSTILKTAGHSIQTEKQIFSFLNFGETYRYAGTSPAWDKKDWLGFNFSEINFPLELSAESFAKNTGTSQSQNYKAQLKSDIKSNSWNFYMGSNLLASQDQQIKTTNKNNYFVTWYNASKQEFSKGEQAAQRKVSFNSQLKAAIPFAKLSPDFNLEFSNTEKSKQQGLSTADSFKLSIPFSAGNNAFSVNLNHSAAFEQNATSNKNYGDDLNTLFANQIEFNNLYSAIPYYSLFDKSLRTKLKQKVIAPQITYANQLLEYDIQWKRKLFNSLKDLYIPSSATAGASRSIISTGATTSDTYQIKASATSTYINPKQEYTGTLSALYKFSPIDSNTTSFVINSNELLLFYIDNSNTVTVNADLSFDQKVNWSFKSTAAWNRSSLNSLVLTLTKLIWKKSQQMDFKTTIRDSALIALSRQNKINKQTYEYSRSSEISYTDNVSITSGAGILFGFEQNKTFRISLNYNLGIKISY